MVVFQLWSEKLHWNHGNIGKSWDLGFLGWLAPLTYVKDLSDVFHRMPQPFKGHQKNMYIMCIYIYYTIIIFIIYNMYVYIYNVYTQLHTIQCYHDSGVWQIVSSCSQTKLVRFIGQKQPRQSGGQSSYGPSPNPYGFPSFCPQRFPSFTGNILTQTNQTSQEKTRKPTQHIKLSKLILIISSIYLEHHHLPSKSI